MTASVTSGLVGDARCQRLHLLLRDTCCPGVRSSDRWRGTPTNSCDGALVDLRRGQGQRDARRDPDHDERQDRSPALAQDADVVAKIHLVPRRLSVRFRSSERTCRSPSGPDACRYACAPVPREQTLTKPSERRFRANHAELDVPAKCWTIDDGAANPRAPQSAGNRSRASRMRDGRPGVDTTQRPEHARLNHPPRTVPGTEAR